MKPIILVPTILLTMSIFGTSYGAHPYVGDEVMEGSIASQSQLMELGNVIERELKSKNSDENSNKMVNQTLEKLGLPLIDLESEDLNVRLTSVAGTFDSTPVGVEIMDGKHRFCLPCSVAHNDFEWGIIEWKNYPRDVNGKYYSIINKLASYRHDNGVFVNSRVLPERRRALILVRSETRSGILVLYDNAAEFFNVPVPVKAMTSTDNSIKASEGEIRVLIRASALEDTYYVETRPPKDGSDPISSTPIDEAEIQSIISSL